MKTYIHSKMCVFYSSFTYNGQKVEKFQCPSVDKWINKMWSIHIMEYYSALTGGGDPVTLEHGFLSEIIKANPQKIIPLLSGPGGVRFTEIENKRVVARA